MNDFSNHFGPEMPETGNSPFIPASHGRRFANYIIDIFIFTLLIYPFISYAPVRHLLFGGNDVMKPTLMGQFTALLVYGMYMGIVEGLFKGRSPGKFVTGTCVVKADTGERIDTQTALLRGLCRVIPFEWLSAITFPCLPWHDRWSKSRVVRMSQGAF